MFKERKWGRYKDVTVFNYDRNTYLIQVSECELTGIKKFKKTLIADDSKHHFNEIKNKLNL